MNDSRETITLATATDTYNFRVGQPVTLVYSDGQFRVATRWERLRMRLGDSWRKWTRWWRPRTVCSEIDREAGSITMEMQRWSWRRWRWERM